MALVPSLSSLTLFALLQWLLVWPVLSLLPALPSLWLALVLPRAPPPSWRPALSLAQLMPSWLSSVRVLMVSSRVPRKLSLLLAATH